MYTVLSDDKGGFDLVVPAGKVVRVRTERLGYDAASSMALTLKPGEVIDIAVRMGPGAIVLREVEVVARRPVDWRLQPFLERRPSTDRLGWDTSGPVRISSASTRPSSPTWCGDSCPHGSALPGTALYVDNLPVSEESLDLVVSPRTGGVGGVSHRRNAGRLGRAHPHGEPQRSAKLNPDGLKPCLLMLAWRRPIQENLGRVTLGRVARVVGFVGAVFLLNLLAR